MSRLTLKPGRNRRARTPLRDRLPTPRQAADACGRALRRSAPVLATTALLAGVAVAGHQGYRWLTTSPRFAVTTIEVHGETALSEAAVRARLPLAVGDNIFRVDTGDAEAALVADPWIAGATVRRRLPHTIVVEIVEHRAAAVVASEGLYLADAAGRPFKPADTTVGEGRDLPIISGIPRELFATQPTHAEAQVRAGLLLLAAWRSGERPRLGEVRLAPGGATVYTYDDAIAIQVGAVDRDALGPRLARFDAVWAALSPEERRALRTLRVDNATRTDLVTVSFRDL